MDPDEPHSDDDDIPEAESDPQQAETKGSSKCLGFTILVFIVFLLFLKWQEGKFLRSGAPITDDLYDTLGVDSTATQLAIRQKYRALSKTMHPDRNPNCEDCAARFQRVVEAYEVLSDPERRDAYDNSYSKGKRITSHTHQITAGNYQRLVLDSYDYWVLQVYRDGDTPSEKFSPVWEQVAADLDGLVKFGRINGDREADLIPSLPFKIKIYPSVFAMGRTGESSIFPYEKVFDPVEFTRLIKESLPNAIEMMDKVHIEDALDESTSAVGFFFRDKSDTPFVYKVLAFRYRFDMKFIQISPDHINEVRSYLEVSPRANLAVLYRPGLEIKRLVVTDKLTPQSIASTISKAGRLSWPEVFSDNYQHLCRGDSLLCLVSIGPVDELLRTYSYSTKKEIQFARLNPVVHDLPAEFTHRIVVVHPVTNDIIGFGSSEKAIDYLNTYSPEEDIENRWESGVELQNFLRYRGYSWWKAALGLLFTWGGFGAAALLYISYKILF